MTVMKRPAVKSFLQIPETSHLGKQESPSRPEPTSASEPVARPIKPIARRKSKGLKRK